MEITVWWRKSRNRNTRYCSSRYR